MPRRANLEVAIQDLPASQPDLKAENLAILRTQWRWAAFSQFFFTFFPLFALHDVSLEDIEQDLISNTRQVLPRIMQRLLYSLSYDRKVSVDNWQTALRKQYNKRAPQVNPIGQEPPSSIPSKEDDIEQDAEKSAPEIVDDNVDEDGPLNASESGVIDLVSSFGDLTSAPSTAPNQRNSTRQSEERRASSTSKDTDLYPQQKYIDWFDLPMLVKLDSMHTVAEFQFQNPTRLRTIMKSDDEFATWRIEPIGYDSKGNAYWLIGADRLWIQRAPPKPLKAKTLKRKKTSEKESIAHNGKRLRISPPVKPSHAIALAAPSFDRHSRAAKEQAKKRLDAQAKELAELNCRAASASSGLGRQASLRVVKNASSLVVGTRSSARLRGLQEDEWQPIPEEWLKEAERSRTGLRNKTGLETDEGSVSDLTELSDDNLEPPLIHELNGHHDNIEEEDHGPFEPDPPPNNFVEWETICSTLQEWEHIAERFAKATHYSEKALHKVLVNDIVPVISHELREVERKRHLEEAIIRRKRSSRIALKESEKEEARMSAVKKREEQEKMSRARRLEARKQREEEERIKREQAREQRKQEREAKEDTKEAQVETEGSRALPQVAKKHKSILPPHDTRTTYAQKANEKDTSSGSRTPVGEDWELACEICNQQGANLDDGTPMMSCGICSRWQHIQCHDRADRMAGLPRRNWKSEEFICSRCRATQRVEYFNHPPTSKQFAVQNAGRGPSLQAHASSQLNLPSSSYHRSSHYLSSYNTPLSQNHFGRSNGQRYADAQHPSSLEGPSIFSHYLPSQHGFLPRAPNKILLPNVQTLYPHTNSNAFQHQHRHDHISSQSPAWTPHASQSTSNLVHSNVAIPLPTSSYMPSQADNHDLQAVHTYSNHKP